MTTATLQTINPINSTKSDNLLPWAEDLNSTRENNQLFVATVSGVHADHYDIIDSILRRGIRAASCLAIPQVGDSVLVFCSSQQLWIIAVLSGAGSCNLALEGSQIQVQGDQLTFRANEIQTTSDQWHASHNTLSLFTSQFMANIVSLEWIGKKLSTWIDLISCNSRRTMRNVSEIESVQCGNYDLQVHESMALSADNAVITAQNLIKVDGEQVHVG